MAPTTGNDPTAAIAVVTSGVGRRGSSSAASPGASTAEAGVPAAEPSAHPLLPPGKVAMFASVRSPGAPEGIAVAPDGTVFVTTDNGTSRGRPGPSQILTYDATGAPGRLYTVTGQPQNHATGLTGVVLDGRGGLLALDASSARVLRFDLATGHQSVLATIPDLPACLLVIATTAGCEPGVQDNAPSPRGAALDRSGDLYVTDAGQGVIWRIPNGGGAPVLAYSDLAFGSGDGLGGLALAPDGALVVASPQPFDPAAAGGGALYRITGAGTAASSRSMVARFAPFEGPAGVVARNDGSFVVTLRDAGAVALIGLDGTERRRVTDPSLDTPIGAAFAGSTLLVAARSDRSGNGAVIAVGIA
jgi:sugar lactone lactonase YvrE